MNWRPWAYEKLDAGDSDREADQPRSSRTQDGRQFFRSVVQTLAIALALLLSTVSIAISISRPRVTCQPSTEFSPLPSVPHRGHGESSTSGYGKIPKVPGSNHLYSIPAPVYDCGTTYSEAEEKGCVFDPVISGWQDPICSSAGAKEFLDFAGEEPYEFYADKNGTVSLTEEQRSKTAYWYSTRRYHVSHCLFMMVRAMRAVEAGERFSFEQFGSPHAQHCVKNILHSLELHDTGWNDINAHGASAFVRC